MIKLRNWFWNYPEKLFFGPYSLAAFLGKIYYAGAPFTTALLLIILLIGPFLFLYNNQAYIVNGSDDLLIEGVVVGIDPNTKRLVQLNKISPLVPDSNKSRLEKDLIELIYESLIRVDQNGNIQQVLADYLEVERGKKYRFKLKDNIYWHDGKPITVEDVIATFELLKKLDANPTTQTMFSKAAAQLNLNKIENDPKAFEFEVKGNVVIPGLFEALSFKILPSHLLNDVTPENINFSDPYINRNPVGSGPYRFFSKTEDAIDLTVFDEYHGEVPAFKTLKFKFFASESSAIDAVKTGQIHTLMSSSYRLLDEIAMSPNLGIAKTNIFYNQYWAMSFNLGESGNSILKDIKVRQAISYSINKDKILTDVLHGYGAVADGPIPPISFAYTNQYKYTFDQAKARELLDSAGWKLEEGFTFRTKDGVKCTFKLAFVDNPERINLANAIKDQLAEIGVEVDLEPYSSANIKDVLSIRGFDALLYGTQTFIDPDRYELFHSSQIADPGLNFTSWSSTEKRGAIVDGKQTQIPKSDDDLDTARRTIDTEERKKFYKEFQKLIMADAPIVFLYYPQEAYIYNKRLSRIVLEDMNSINQRFLKISLWKMGD